jgi:hypothetical protein
MTDRIYEPTLRMSSTYDGPLRGDQDYQIGFYDAGVMRQILNHLGEGECKIYTLPIPRNDKEFRIAAHYLNDPKVQYALVDKSQGSHKVVYCVVENSPGWMSVLSELGYDVYSGPKTNKRLKSFHRPTLLNADFDHLNLHIVSSTEYTRYDFYSSETDMGVADRFISDDVRDRLLDGGFVISRRILDQAISNIPLNYHFSQDQDSSNYYHDSRIRAHLINYLSNDCRIFNARLITPYGFIKGNAIVADLDDNVDIITSEANIKSEIKYTKGYRFLGEPQGAKERVLTDHQTIINFPHLFPKPDMEMWLKETYDKIFNQAISEKYYDRNNSDTFQYTPSYDSPINIAIQRHRDDTSLVEQESRKRTEYIGHRWLDLKMKYTDSPWLFKTTTINKAKPYQERISIPCSVYEQIIPESLARMAGYDIEVEEETIIRLNDLKVHVVSDIDWVEMYTSHGGHDQDDFFKLFYRTMDGGDFDGERVVIVMRSPNGYGEYTIFRYVENSFAPTWHKADGTPIQFPHVDGTNWPMRLSSAVNFGVVQYSGLPSASRPKEKRTGLYGSEDVLRDIKIAMTGGSVGSFVNAAMAHSYVLAKHRPVQLCSLEDAIDKCINPDDVQDVQAIDLESRAIIQEILDSGEPIDRSLWYGRKIFRSAPEGFEANLIEGRLTQFFQLCSSSYRNFTLRVDAWAQENARPPEIVDLLGARLYSFALPVLNNFRANVQLINSTETEHTNNVISREHWDTIYDYIVYKINSYERIEDRHDFVMGLYSASLNKATTLGNISDQPVMNRHVFPYLEAALEFYGIVPKIEQFVHEDGSISTRSFFAKEWTHVTSNGDFLTFDNPLDYQKAHKNDSPLQTSMPPAKGAFDHLLPK